jgi:pseudoazurin
MIKFAAIALAAMALTGAAQAAEFTINMVNKDANGQTMQFEPAFLKAAPGDIVHFVAVDKGHDTESLVVPDGAQPWKGKISQNFDVTLTAPGLYVFKCTPHYPMGMVGLIEVGDAPANLAAVKAFTMPSKPTAKLAELLEDAGIK